MMSADMNIDHGESSCSEVATVLNDFPAASVAVPASLRMGAGCGASGKAATGGGGAVGWDAVAGNAAVVAASCCAWEGAGGSVVRAAKLSTAKLRAAKLRHFPIRLRISICSAARIRTQHSGRL
jgi:hypothetical protein